LCQKIYTVEIFNELLFRAKNNTEKLKIKNIIYKLGNGVNGWEEKILFDAIIVSAASEEIPPKLLQNLKNNGKLIIPIKYSFDNQKLILVKKTGENSFESFYSKTSRLRHNPVQNYANLQPQRDLLKQHQFVELKVSCR